MRKVKPVDKIDTNNWNETVLNTVDVIVDTATKKIVKPAHRVAKYLVYVSVAFVLLIIGITNLSNYRVFNDRNPSFYYLFQTRTQNHPVEGRMDIDLKYYLSAISEIMWEFDSVYIKEYSRKMSYRDKIAILLYLSSLLTLLIFLLFSKSIFVILHSGGNFCMDSFNLLIK